MRIRITFACVSLFVATTFASQVVNQKLEDVIGKINVIAMATVQDVKKDGRRRTEYSIKVPEVLAGDLTKKELTVVFYEPGSPYFSVITPASGIEGRWEKGQTYVFMFRCVEKTSLGVSLTRAESANRRKIVMAEWTKKRRPKE